MPHDAHLLHFLAGGRAQAIDGVGIKAHRLDKQRNWPIIFRMEDFDAAADTRSWSWSRWYRAAREEAAFRYGLRRIPVDVYKNEYVCCTSVTHAVRNIARQIGEPVGR